MQEMYVYKHKKKKKKKPIYIRYENLKHIVLYELLSQHDHAELDAKLNEAARWSTLSGRRANICLRQNQIYCAYKQPLICAMKLTSSMR